MPRTIEEGFNEFLTKLTPTNAETAAAKSHRASIESCLKTYYGLNRFFRIGSFGNGTSISGYSDIDYLASIPTNSLKANSAYSLKLIRDTLDARFPYTGVKVSSPAIVLPFGTVRSETTEVVPGDFIKKDGSFYAYDIADGDGGWMRASPDAHIAYVRSIDESLYRRVKPLIRLVKAWKYFRDVPISSFYLELRVTKYASEEKSIIYDIDLKNVLCMLRRIGLANIQDPMGVSGYISACKTTVQLEDALSKLDTAAIRAEKAREASVAKRFYEAFEYWRLLYNNQFPTYYF